jgi:hypothetical protein
MQSTIPDGPQARRVCLIPSLALAKPRSVEAPSSGHLQVASLDCGFKVTPWAIRSEFHTN